MYKKLRSGLCSVTVSFSQDVKHFARHYFPHPKQHPSPGSSSIHNDYEQNDQYCCHLDAVSWGKLRTKCRKYNRKALKSFHVEGCNNLIVVRDLRAELTIGILVRGANLFHAWGVGNIGCSVR